jgi:hypothetical protein
MPLFDPNTAPKNGNAGTSDGVIDNGPYKHVVQTFGSTPDRVIEIVFPILWQISITKVLSFFLPFCVLSIDARE